MASWGETVEQRAARGVRPRTLRRSVRLVRAGDGAVICRRCEVAETFWTRFVGLLGRRALARGAGLAVVPAQSIHMFFMRFAIDAVFVDADGVVLRVVQDLRPWRAAWCRGAASVVELPAGWADAAGIAAGDVLLAESADASLLLR